MRQAVADTQRGVGGPDAGLEASLARLFDALLFPKLQSKARALAPKSRGAEYSLLLLSLRPRRLEQLPANRSSRVCVRSVRACSACSARVRVSTPHLVVRSKASRRVASRRVVWLQAVQDLMLVVGLHFGFPIGVWNGVLDTAQARPSPRAYSCRRACL